MSAVLKPQPVGHRTDEASWAPLYRVGAVAALLGLVAYLVGIVLVAVQGGYPSDGWALLPVVAENRGWYAARQLIWLMPCLGLAVVSVAVAIAYRRVAPVLAALAGGLGAGAWLLSFAWPTTGDGSLAMIWLADRFVSAGNPDAQASLVGAAELLIALNDAPNVLGVLQTASILLLSVLVLRAGRRTLGWLGVATGAVGLGCEIARPWLGWGYAAYGLLLLGWLALLVPDLLRVSRSVTGPETPRSRGPQ